jgi:hypothetical protein
MGYGKTAANKRTKTIWRITLKLYFQGAHLPTYRNLIKETGTPSSSLSYLGLRGRTNFGKPWLVKKYFPEGHSLFVDSGCQVLNNEKEPRYTNEELLEIAEHYYSWISQNINEIEIYSEFDALQLGKGYIEGKRDSVREELFDKFLPIWRPDDGVDDLNYLAERFGKIGITQTNMHGRDLVLVLNRLASAGVQLHGLAMTKQDIMQAVNWTSVSSTSWVSPQKYGATFVWSHNQLKSYSKEQKEQARRKERFVIEAAGFDVEKILNDDPKELLRLSLWSWSQFVASINAKKSRGVTTSVKSTNDDFMEKDEDEVGAVLEPVRNTLPTVKPRDPNKMVTIPLLQYESNVEKKRNIVTGEEEDVQRPLVRVRGDSMRICDTCFLAAKCPMFEENSTCAYTIPIQVRNKEQVQALMDALVEMQTQRVLFMKMAEDAEGGHADPILSSEIDRLSKLMKTKHDMEQEGFSLTVTAKQSGQNNLMAKMFSPIAPKAEFQALEAAPADDYISQIVDVETDF